MKYLVTGNESADNLGVLSASSRPRIYVGGDNKVIKLTFFNGWFFRHALDCEAGIIKIQ
ncbi:hypothetical protein [Peribacillus butanolivorans]|uniref:hypothetical protein n=1 Tax=Peribacillus butanolivorans TaxID=421767 RepID=UPI0035E1D864